MHSNHSTRDFLFLADNLALDFINTEYGTDEGRHDCFSDDQRVMDWLNTAGLWPEGAPFQAPAGLLFEAHALRARARALVDAAMKGFSTDLGLVNNLYENGRPIRRLEWEGEVQRYHITTSPGEISTAMLLWPVVNALIDLIVSDKFAFVRQCEAHDCILLFHDLSKSHRRRWCSMATCGNRMKVAAFRSRKKPVQA
ncbi:CGNR zinc finger domain-containing protein [Pantoea ananatis]|uniref:CGNR zinc finger domain-containing protein n=1 Tax=Pantoea ananas TaxID=553 RepID=UPI00352B3471